MAQWVPARTAIPERSITVAMSWACAAAISKATIGPFSGALPKMRRPSICDSRCSAAVSDAGPTETLDPHAIASVVDQYRAFNLYDRLAETQIDGTVKPHLAESIEAADDTSTTWIVKLRSGVTFHACLAVAFAL